MAAASGSSRSRWTFLVMMFLISVLVGWYVNTKGMVGCSVALSTGSEMNASRGVAKTRSWAWLIIGCG